jgi:hypothetical protein
MNVRQFGTPVTAWSFSASLVHRNFIGSAGSFFLASMSSLHGDYSIAEEAIFSCATFRKAL